MTCAEINEMFRTVARTGKGIVTWAPILVEDSGVIDGLNRTVVYGEPGRNVLSILPLRGKIRKRAIRRARRQDPLALMFFQGVMP